MNPEKIKKFLMCVSLLVHFISLTECKIIKKTNEICNEIQKDSFSWGPCMFKKNSTPKLLIEFDNERLYNISMGENIDTSTAGQIKDNVQQFFTEEFCGIVQLEIVHLQETECNLYSTIKNVLENLNDQLQQIENSIISASLNGSDSSLKEWFEMLAKTLKREIQTAGRKLESKHEQIEQIKSNNVIQIRNKIISKLLNKFFSEYNLSRYGSNAPNPDRNRNIKQVTTNATSRVERAFDFMYHQYKNLSQLVQQNLDTKESYYNDPSCEVNAVSLVSEKAQKAACELTTMIKSHTECRGSTFELTTPGNPLTPEQINAIKCRCLKDFIQKNLPKNYQNKFLNALATGNEHGLAYSLKSLCIQKSTLVAFFLVDLALFIHNETQLSNQVFNIPELDLDVIQTTIAFFIGSLQQGLQCSMMGLGAIPA